MNYKNNCRTCLNTGKEMRHINSTILIGGKDVKLTDILKNFYNYQITEESSLPEDICINCVHQLTITYSFKILIDSSMMKLVKSLPQLDSTSDTYDYHIDCEEQRNPLKKTSYENKPYKKNKMNKSFISMSDEIKSIFCVECKAEFHSVKSLNEHCINNHTVKSEIGRDCDYCNEKFEDFRSLVLHRKLHLKPYLCENCWEGFYSEDEMNSHLCQPNVHREKNRVEKVLLQCDQCGKSYPPSYMRIHILTHGNDRPYSCKYCPKKFKVPGSLHSHILWNHKRTRNYKCEVCNATFISSSSRSSHIRKNHLKEKKYRCDNCGKRFFSKSELQRHSLTHTGVKDFHCHLCDKSYQTRYGLNIHLRSHSQINMNALNL